MDPSPCHSHQSQLERGPTADRGRLQPKATEFAPTRPLDVSVQAANLMTDALAVNRLVKRCQHTRRLSKAGSGLLPDVLFTSFGTYVVEKMNSSHVRPVAISSIVEIHDVTMTVLQMLDASLAMLDLRRAWAERSGSSRCCPRTAILISEVAVEVIPAESPLMPNVQPRVIHSGRLSRHMAAALRLAAFHQNP